MTNREKFEQTFGYDGSIVSSVIPNSGVSVLEQIGSCGYTCGCKESCASRRFPRCPKWWDDEYSMTHEIKILEEFADAVYAGDKTFEVRKNDRGYQKGDIVKFEVRREGNSFTLPAREHPLNGKEYQITYVFSGWGIEEGYVVFGIKPVEAE